MTKSQDIPGLIELADDEALGDAFHAELRKQGAFSVEAYGKVALGMYPFIKLVADALSAAPKSEGAVTGLVKLRVDDLQIGPEPTVEWEDPRVQAVYEIICDDKRPPNPEEHWEGYQARLIVDALASNPLPAAREEVGVTEAMVEAALNTPWGDKQRPVESRINDAQPHLLMRAALEAALRQAPAATSQEAVEE